MKTVIPNQIYRHYKGNEYRVLHLAKHTETMEDMVVYTPTSGEAYVWARPLSMWHETVTVEGREMPRFALIKDAKD